MPNLVLRDNDKMCADLAIGEQIRGGEDLLDEGLINENYDLITEGTAVTFENKTYPKDGWMVILAGGAGSGKGSTLKNQILIDAKVVDVDKLKELFNGEQKLLNKKLSENDPVAMKKLEDIINSDYKDLFSKDGKFREFSFKNAEDVSTLHAIIGKAREGKDPRFSELGDAYKHYFLDSAKNSKEKNGRLPNVILDITGKSKVDKYALEGKKMGYKVSVVWVLTNRQWAIFRNLQRDRLVSQEVFHTIHNMVKKAMIDIMNDADLNKGVDEFWLVWSGQSGDVLNTGRVRSIESLKGTAFKLKRTGEGKFELDSNDEKLITNLLGGESLKADGDETFTSTAVKKFLGPDELNPNDPQTYKDFDKFRSEIDSYKETYLDKDGKVKTKLSSNLKVSGFKTGQRIKEGVERPDSLYNRVLCVDENKSIEDILDSFKLFSSEFKFIEEAMGSIDLYIEKAYIGDNAEEFKRVIKENREVFVSMALKGISERIESLVDNVK